MRSYGNVRGNIYRENQPLAKGPVTRKPTSNNKFCKMCGWYRDRREFVEDGKEYALCPNCRSKRARYMRTWREKKAVKGSDKPADGRKSHKVNRNAGDGLEGAKGA